MRMIALGIVVDDENTTLLISNPDRKFDILFGVSEYGQHLWAEIDGYPVTMPHVCDEDFDDWLQTAEKYGVTRERIEKALGESLEAWCSKIFSKKGEPTNAPYR